MTPEIEFTVAATNGKPQRMVVACWNDGVFRARVDVVTRVLACDILQATCRENGRGPRGAAT